MWVLERALPTEAAQLAGAESLIQSKAEHSVF